jgi:hypothetical protein
MLEKDGSAYHRWRMDAVEMTMVFEDGVTDWAVSATTRGDDASCVWRNWYTGAVTSGDEGAQIVADKNNGTIVKGTVAGNEGGDGFNIEFADKVWAGVFPGSLFITDIGNAGDVLYMDMQVGDADIDKDARDYQLFLGTESGEARNGIAKDEWIKITLGGSGTSVNNLSSRSGFSIFPNRNPAACCR